MPTAYLPQMEDLPQCLQIHTTDHQRLSAIEWPFPHHYSVLDLTHGEETVASHRQLRVYGLDFPDRQLLAFGNGVDTDLSVFCGHETIALAE